MLAQNRILTAETLITEEVMMTKHRITPIHPGVYLKELLNELRISQYRLAKEL